MSDTYTEFKPGRYDQREVETQGYGMVNYGSSDERKIILFYNKSVHQPRASQEQGRPVYNDVVFVRIGDPGEMKLSMIDRPATEEDKRRWPRHWMQFQNNAKQVPDGTPVDMLFPEKPSIIGTLKAFGVHTIEQLSHLSAEGIATVGMGATEWVNRAKKYMERAEKGVGFHKLESELKARDTEIAVLKDNQARLQAQLELLMSQRGQFVNINAPSTPQDFSVAVPDFDAQTSQINIAGHERDYTLPPTAFDNAIGTQITPKRRGRPPKAKES